MSRRVEFSGEDLERLRTARGLAGAAPAAPRRRIEREIAAFAIDGQCNFVSQPNGFPFRCVAYLRLHRQNGSIRRGTGFFISPSVLLTAGHNIRPRGSPIVGIDVLPMFNGSGTEITAADFQVAPDYDVNDPTHDYGAVFLGDEEAGACFGAHATADAELPALELTLNGYPVDDVRPTNCRGRVDTENTDGFLLYHTIPTLDGHSGSPVWAMHGGNPMIVAIHTFIRSDGARGGVRITDDVIAQINIWAPI